MTKTKTTISKKKKSTKKLNFKNFFIFTIIFATLVASLPNLFSTDKSASAIENEAYCTSSACRAANARRPGGGAVHACPVAGSDRFLRPLQSGGCCPAAGRRGDGPAGGGPRASCYPTRAR